MEKLPNMVDMSLDHDEQVEMSSPAMAAQPRYPYGLSISLGHAELEKLGVDYQDWSVGDMFHLHSMARITSISKNETDKGQCCRVEMQIIALAGEDEDSENEESEQKMEAGSGRRLY